MDLVFFLKDWRRRHNMTQAVAAKALGIALPTYRGLEQGRHTPYERVIEMAVKNWDREGKVAHNG